MIVRCPHCGTGHTVRYQPGRSPASQRCEACGKAFAFFPALEIESVGLPVDRALMEPIPTLQVPTPRRSVAAERPAPSRSPLSRLFVVATRWIPQHAHDRATRIGGLAVGLALIAALVLQFLVHERAALAEHPEFAALSDALCRQLPCPHPRGHLPGTIRVGELQLATHEQGWLVVEFLITNAHDRPQAWPLLELALSDRFGRMLARARWEPREYLVPAETAQLLGPGEVRRLRLVIDRPAGVVEGISVRTL
jgi:hypothetical protein